jgi:peroxiredoxin
VSLGGILLVVAFVVAYLLKEKEEQDVPLMVTSSASPAPNFTLEDLSGQRVSLSDFRGRVTVLNFWATWCLPCKRELPSLQQLQEKFRPDSLTVVTISVDQDRSALEYFVRQGRYSFLVLWDRQKTASQQFGVAFFPQSYVVDKAGRLVDVIVGETDWASRDKIVYLTRLVNTQE